MKQIRNNYYAALLKVIMPLFVTDVIVAWSLCVLSSVTLVRPAKAVGQNEMPYGRNTRVCPSNIVLDRGPSPPQEGEIW